MLIQFFHELIAEKERRDTQNLVEQKLSEEKRAAFKEDFTNRWTKMGVLRTFLASKGKVENPLDEDAGFNRLGLHKFTSKEAFVDVQPSSWDGYGAQFGSAMATAEHEVIVDAHANSTVYHVRDELLANRLNSIVEDMASEGMKPDVILFDGDWQVLTRLRCEAPENFNEPREPIWKFV